MTAASVLCVDILIATLELQSLSVVWCSSTYNQCRCIVESSSLMAHATCVSIGGCPHNSQSKTEERSLCQRIVEVVVDEQYTSSTRLAQHCRKDQNERGECTVPRSASGYNCRGKRVGTSIGGVEHCMRHTTCGCSMRDCGKEKANEMT